MLGDELVQLLAGLVLEELGHRQDDAAVLRIHLDHVQGQGLGLLEVILGLVDLGDRQVADGHEALQLGRDLHDHAVIQHADDLALDLAAHGIVLGQGRPGVLLQLLDAEADAPLVGVDVQDLDLHRVALAHDLLGMADPLGPGHVRDVHQAVDALLHFDEGAEVGEVADATLDDRADGEAVVQRQPGIRLGLLEAEGDLLVVLVYLQDHDLDEIADGQDLARMLDVARPGHLADVDQALDALLQLHEGAVVGDRDDLALHDALLRVLRLHVLPRIGLKLLQTEGDALAVAVEVQDLDLDLVADVDDFARVLHAAPGEVRDVQQPVDAAQVHEGAEIGDVLHHAGAHLVLVELLHQRLLLGLALALENDAAADHHVAPALVLLDDLALDLLADHLVQVGHLAQGDLRAGQEGVDVPQLDDQPALDAAVDGAGDDIAALVGHLDLVPDLEEVGALLGQNHQTVLVLEVFQEDVELVAFLDLGAAELVEGDDALALEADVQQDLVLANLDHRALEDLSLLDLVEGLLVLVEQRQHGVVVQDLALGVVAIDDRGLVEGGGQLGSGGHGRGETAVVVSLAGSPAECRSVLWDGRSLLRRSFLPRVGVGIHLWFLLKDIFTRLGSRASGEYTPDRLYWQEHMALAGSGALRCGQGVRSGGKCACPCGERSSPYGVPCRVPSP